MISVQPAWCQELSLQQQSVLFLAARGPDGINKKHPCKNIQRAYRATVMVAAKYGRMMNVGEKFFGDDFMALDRFAHPGQWSEDVKAFFQTVDDLPHHFLMHLYHGAEIIGYKHPDSFFRERWLQFYIRGCEDMHVDPETGRDMDRRLNDWSREYW